MILVTVEGTVPRGSALLPFTRGEWARDSDSNQWQVRCCRAASRQPGRRDRALADRQQSIAFWSCAVRCDKYRPWTRGSLSIGVSNGRKKTTSATDIDNNMASKIRTQDDVNTWHIGDNFVEERNRTLSMPAHFASFSRADGRFVVLEKTRMPNLSNSPRRDYYSGRGLIL